MDRAKWAHDLFVLAAQLDVLTADDLRKNEDLHDECRLLIHRFAIRDEISKAIEDQVQYPPEWDNLRSAVEGVSPDVVLDNMWGWVAVGRWMEAPLAEIHEKGWLVPALRRVAGAVDELDLQPGVDF